MSTDQKRKDSCPEMWYLEASEELCEKAQQNLR